MNDVCLRADYHNDSTGALVATSAYLSPWVEINN